VVKSKNHRKYYQNTHKVVLDEGSEWIRHNDQIWPHGKINNSLFPSSRIINLLSNDNSTQSESTHTIEY